MKSVSPGIVRSAAWLAQDKGQDKLARMLLIAHGIKTLLDLSRSGADPDDITLCEMLW